MARLIPLRDAARVPRGTRIEIAALAAACLAFLAVSPSLAQDNSTAAADQKCLGCHGSAGLEKKLEDGDTLKLQVPGDVFEKSVHRAVGCTGCHSDVDPATHPPADKKIDSARSFQLQMTQACKTCHTDKFDDWQKSIHAALVRAGNPNAPVCTDCHNPHAVTKGAAATLDQIPCQKCHKDVYTAYIGSVHGQSRLHVKDSYAPVCTGCHTAHAVKPVAVGPLAQGPEGACLGCHAGVIEAHEKWLPNAGLHFEAVSCPACHAVDAQRKVDLMLVDAKNATARGTEKLGVPLFEASTRSDGKGIDAMTLFNLLQTLNRDGVGKTVLRGRLEVFNGAQIHQIGHKNQAISDCRICHSSASKAFQSVSISLVGPDGRRVGYGASADVLNSVISLGSVGGFYAIGATRIGILDILLVLAILGGVGIAVGHVVLGWIFKFYGLYQPHGHGPAAPPSGDRTVR